MPTPQLKLPDSDSSLKIVDPRVSIVFATESIEEPTNWSIASEVNTLVVHLAGEMSYLETELDGKSTSFGAAAVGEVWGIPSQACYKGSAKGGTIGYAVIDVPNHSPCDYSERFDFRIKSVAAKSDSEFLRHLGAIYTCAKEKREQLTIDTEVSHLLDRILTQYSSDGDQKDSSQISQERSGAWLSDTNTRKLREYMHDNLSDVLRLNELGKVVGLSSHQLLVAFRRAFGTTPAQYVIHERIRRARLLLSQSREDITTIALRCGFNSHSHLTSTFTTMVGMPPKKYRADNARSVLFTLRGN